VVGFLYLNIMHKKLEDISDEEIEFYMTISDFSAGKTFFILLLVSGSLSYIIGDIMALLWTILVVCGARFLLLPIYLNVVGKMAKKSNPAQYREFLDWKKKEYYQKFYSKENNSMQTTQQQQSFISRTFKGDLGLPISFWVFGVLAFFAVAGIREVSYDTESTVTIFDALFATYAFIAFIIVGRAAQKYQGAKVWKILALIYAFVLLAIQLPAFVLIDLLGL
jgi:hypothetical protein